MTKSWGGTMKIAVVRLGGVVGLRNYKIVGGRDEEKKTRNTAQTVRWQQIVQTGIQCIVSTKCANNKTQNTRINIPK